MENWRILDLTSFKGHVGYRRGQLIVQRDAEGEDYVPLADVSTLLIGLHTSISGAVLQQLAAFDVITLVCDWRGVPVGGMYGWRDHTRVGARHLAQSEASVPRCKNAWGRIISAKVHGQATNLRLADNEDWPELDRLARSVRSGDPDNIEARAARLYWRRVFDEPMGRWPGSGIDRNGLLDYGYTVLRGHAVRAVLSAGLSPSLGLFHRGRGNFFNLADDLMEPFRPAVDWVVSQLDADISPDHPAVKHALVRASTQVFASDGKSVSSCLTDLAQQLGRYFERDVDRLTVPAWDGPSSG
ncbi:type II CRISPR-associated endonuclease Cas1 [Propionimicrobium sp. PCR01-08-3]|uniref:type II CRISPR-associated endonuclease Cas1 n=1 Tax=Propionimicrobium sp. PCR01-08-3 TaxID=3052086 RepID=UPI00255D1451|nr:type II CRISPR-associated endonuclease Cas1 [Propionimicrobium sp. PCR01-08-3]WIY81812.1 type II CRISPR-associated endonuclease Cas1 [Propionimicrobium sp. PCR01-08-3]